MPLTRFGKLELDVPADWADHSVITLLGKPTGLQGGELQPTLMLSRVPSDGTFTAEQLGKSQLQSLRKDLPELEVVSEGPLDIDGTKAYQREVRFPIAQRGVAQQLHVFVVKGPMAYTLVGVASSGEPFEKLRSQLLAMASSFKTL